MDDKSSGFRISELARKVINVDGKMLGKDGKPLLARRNVVHNIDIGSKTHQVESDMLATSNADGKEGAVDGSTSGKDGVASTTVEMHEHHMGSSSGSTGLHAVQEPSEIDKLAAGVKLGGNAPVKGDQSVFKSGGPVFVSTDDGSQEPLKAKPSFASVVKDDKTQNRVVNFRFLQSEEKIDDVDVTITRASVIEVQKRFEHTLYGYFLGKRLAFPIVENYVKNAWGKFGITRVMMNANGFFFFKFSSKAGMDRVLEEGSWLIRAVPLILNVWSPNVILKKEDIVSVPVWVKLHDVPLAAFSEDGLSMIASQIGTPKMMDAYTSSMCLESWGRSSYARVLIELKADQNFKEDIVVAIPDIEGNGYSKQTIHVEYEWRPPRCDTCKAFGHSTIHCPKNVKEVRPNEVKEDGFKGVPRKGKGKNVDGLRLNKPKPGFYYRPIQKPKTGGKQAQVPKEQTKEVNKTSTSNSFEVLQSEVGKPVDVLGKNQGTTPSGDLQKEDRGKQVETSSSGGKGGDYPSLVTQENVDFDSDDDEVYDEYGDEMAKFMDAFDRRKR